MSGFKKELEEPEERRLLIMTVEMMGAVIRDYNTSIRESMRINKILDEAASSLRANFMVMNDAANNAGSVGAEFQEAFQEVIGTLQFEDITSQIIFQQVNHQRLAKSMLQKTQDVLDELMHEPSLEKQAFLARVLREEFEAFIRNIPKFDSVHQHDLTVGETELF